MITAIVITAVICFVLSGTMGLAATNMTNPASGALRLWGWIFSVLAGIICGIVYSVSANEYAWWILIFAIGSGVFSLAIIESIRKIRGR